MHPRVSVASIVATHNRGRATGSQHELFRRTRLFEGTAPSERFSDGVWGARMERLGHRRVVLHTINENAIRALANDLAQEAACDVILRTSPPVMSALLANG